MEGEGKEKIGMSSELKRCGGRRVRMEGENGGREWRVRMEDEDGGCEGRQEKGRRGWRQCVRRVDLACKDVRTYVCILTRYTYLHVHVYINAWLCIVRGLSVCPSTHH